jgi:Cytochrome c3
MKRDNAPAGAGIALLVFTIPALLSCTPTRQSASAEIHPEGAVESESKAAGALPPLIVDTSAPLLLDEAGEGQKATAVAATRAATENSACLVCHANFKTEFLVRRHAAADIGCFHCHGRSLAHQNDENNTTPPQTMYAADQIDPFCRSCRHKTHDVPAREVIARWMERGLDKTDSKSIVCTDCHGRHRMKVRTVIWDKKSGKLLRTNRGG